MKVLTRCQRLVAFVSIALCFAAPAALAQAPNTASTSQLPRLVTFSGTVRDATGVQAGVVGITFAFYKDQQGGAALWLETQNVALSAAGHYTVSLGATRPTGLPIELFQTAEARWLGITVAGQPEQPRVLLLSVPYALKAADAETVGGLPPSAFLLAAPPNNSISNVSNTPASTAAPVGTVTGSGTQNFVPLWTNSTGALGNSVLFQTGTGATANVGINTTTPASTLDVKGAATIRGALSLPVTGTATATAGKNSQAETFTASAFNSSTKAAVNQIFRLQSEPTGNNSAAPSGTLNLLFGSGGTTPAETGLKISSKGLVTFAPGQTFPGTGTGSVSSVALTAPTTDFTVTGSPITSSGALGLKWTVPPTPAATPNAIVKRNSSGGVSVSGIIANDVSTATLEASGEVTIHTNSINSLVATTSAPGGIGILGFGGPSATTYGVYGQSSSSGDGSSAVFGSDTNSSAAAVTAGVIGETQNPAGVGVFGHGSVLSADRSNFGQGAGVWGDSPSNVGVEGTSDTGHGVEGFSGGGIGVLGLSNSFIGVYGSTGEGNAIEAFNSPTLGATDTNATLLATSGSLTSHYVLYAENEDGSAYVRTDGNGNLAATGVVSGALLAAQIDHPLDPANKFLVHSAIQSPDLKTIYDGVALLDASGEATVELPGYVEALNQDFRYQLTSVGAPGPNLYIAEEISGNRFRIAGGRPGSKVSWQVTGIRHDAWANANRAPVERVKAAKEKGRYLHPEAFGVPVTQSITYNDENHRPKLPTTHHRNPAPSGSKTLSPNLPGAHPLAMEPPL